MKYFYNQFSKCTNVHDNNAIVVVSQETYVTYVLMSRGYKKYNRLLQFYHGEGKKLL